MALAWVAPAGWEAGTAGLTLVMDLQGMGKRHLAPRVLKLVSTQTVDESILRMQERKQRLCDETLGEGGEGGDAKAGKIIDAESVSEMLRNAVEMETAKR